MTSLWLPVVSWMISVRLRKRLCKSLQVVVTHAVVGEVLTNATVDILHGSKESAHVDRIR